MAERLNQLALVVNDYDEAITYYTQKLGFELVEDSVLSPVKRWVVVKPAGEGGCNILLARAANDEQRSRAGNQTGGRVFLFLYTDSFDEFYHRLTQNQIAIVRQPSVETYGRVLVFEDLYGNLWDLIESI